LFDALVSLKPTMATSGRRDRGIYSTSLVSLASGSTSGRSPNEPIPLPDSEDEGDTDGDVSMSGTPNPETPTKKRKVEGTPVPSPLKHQRTSNKLPSPDFSDKRMKIQLDELAEHLEQKSKSRIPGLIEPRVIDALMLSTLTHWDLPMNEFFNTLEKQLLAQIKVLFDKWFIKWKGTELFPAAWKIVIEMLNLNLHQQRTTMADESFDDEKAGPYIFHSDLFNREKEAVLQHYRQARFRTRLAIYKKERQARTGKVMTAAEETKLHKELHKDEKIMAVINSEPYSDEIGVAAQITTYFMFAARRFHDSICMRIESKFFKQLRTQLRDELENGLGIHDEVEGMCRQPLLLRKLLIAIQVIATRSVFWPSSPSARRSARSSSHSATHFNRVRRFFSTLRTRSTAMTPRLRSPAPRPATRASRSVYRLHCPRRWMRCRAGRSGHEASGARVISRSSFALEGFARLALLRGLDGSHGWHDPLVK